MTADELLKRYEPKQGATLEYERQLWQSRFSPCGKFLIGVGYDATIQRWAIKDDSFELLAPFTGHNGWLQSLAFTGENNRCVTGDSWGRVSCWDYSAETAAEPLWTVPDALAGWIRAIAVSPDGTQVAIGGNDLVIRILSSTDGTLIRETEQLPHEIFSLTFHPDGASFVAGDFHGTIREFETQTGKQKREFEATGFYQLNHMQDCGGVRQLAFSPDGSQLIAGGMKEPSGGFAKGSPVLQLFNWASGEQLHELVPGDSQDGFIYDAWFHPDGFVVGTASAFPGKGKLFFWNPGDEKPFYVGTKLTNGRSITLHPDGHRLAFTMANSANANGRPLKGDEYIGGTAKIHILAFPEAVAVAAP
ncbi:MAG: WD40 repeat domain-containing protein [Planctomycetales bacterium]|jgi:WD40 repeat protein